MASTSVTTSSSISTLTDFTLVGEAMPGDNGNPWGCPGFDLVDPDDDGPFGFVTWETNFNSGFDTGAVPFAMQANPGGGNNGVTWGILDQYADDPVTNTDVSYGAIQKIMVRAAVSNPARTSITGLVVQFYKGGVVVDSFTASGSLVVDQYSATSAVNAEAILTVTPSRTDCDAVVVSGYLRFQSSGTSEPGEMDMLAQVFLVTA